MKNISKAILLNATWSFLLTQSVIVPFFTDKQLTMKEIFIIQATHSIVLCICDLPSSYISDFFGKRVALLIAGVFRSIGGIVFCIAGGFYGFILAYVFIGVGNGFFYGLNIAILYDLQDDIKTSRVKAENILGLNHYFTKISIVLSAIIGAFVAKYSFAMLALFNAITATIPLLIVLSMTALKKSDHVKSTVTLRYSLQKFISSDYILKGAILAGIAYGVIPFLTLYLSQAILLVQGVSLIYFGIIMAINQIFAAIVAKKIKFINMKIGLVGTALCLAIFPILAFYGLSLQNVFLVVIALLFIEISRSLNETSMRSIVNHLADDNLRASINSLITFGTYTLLFVLSFYVGDLVDITGLSHSLQLMAVAYFIFTLIIMLPLIYQVAKKSVVLNLK